MRLEIEVTTRGLATLADDLARAVKRANTDALQAIASAAAEEAPYKEGNLVDAIHVRQLPDGGEVYVSDAAPYAAYVHRGTGLYGPHRQRIVPREKKALFWPGAPHPVRSVAGQPANPFLDRAAAKAVPKVELVYREMRL